MENLTNRRKLNRILMAISSIVAIATIVFTIVSLTYTSPEVAAFDPTTDVYSSTQAHIVSPNIPVSNDTITMTDAAADYSSIGTKTVTISSDDELYAFSVACKNNTNYLSKNYKLLSNIKYSISSQFIPVGYNGTAFSGTFDGNGYEISNLKMVDITSQIGNASQYSNMTYYAMFSENSGTIKNLGLIESKNTIVSVELDKIINNGGAANLVGKNTGTVQYCYYKDLRDMIEDEIGLAFYGGYRLAGLVYLNEGTFNNSYVAVSTVANHKITGYESISSLCYQNSGYAQADNLNFYDGSIATYSEVSGAIEISYIDDVFFDATFQAGQNVGVYCGSVDALNALYASNNKWYLPSKYDSLLAASIKNTTPILRGLSYTLDSNTGKYTIDISDADDFLYMFELMNGSDFFAGDTIIYEISGDINLKYIDPAQYAYKKLITAEIKGKENAGTIKPTLNNASQSAYPTIFNFNAIAEERKTATLGIDAYGIFPYVGGVVRDLNIVPDAISLDTIDVTNNVKGIAAVSGFVEKGKITNVNTYIVTTHTSTDIKEFYLGGIAGVLGGEGTIENCTSSGSYTMSRFTSALPAESAYTRGDAIGGVVGYVSDTYGSVKTCQSAVTMNLNFNSTNVNYQIGGVIGAAYTIDATELENLGTITVGASANKAVYNALYVSGVIGRHLGVKKQVTKFTNQGTVTVYGDNTAKEIYVSGIENADILTSTISTGLIPSSDKTKDGKYRFMASSMDNRANIVVGSNTIADTVEYTSGINILTKNGFVSELSGIYNLNYTEKYASSNTKTKATLGAFAIDMYTAHKYSGVINVINGADPNAQMTTSLKHVYNLRDLTLSPSTAIAGTYNYLYFGTVRGKNINYEDVRSEGAITATIAKNIGTVGTDNVTIGLIGVLEEVSVGFKATEIYNGKDITLTYSGVNIAGNVIASGICYKNSGYDTSTINTLNPFSTEFDSKAVGGLNNAINNGKITIDNNTNFSSVGVNYSNTVMSANGQSYLGTLPATTYSNVYRISGDIFASGIVCYNEAPITNTFNLGDIFAANYINDTTTEREINVAGIINLNIGQYAYVLNSANNGVLKGINLSSGDTYLSNVNVAGIIARNDELENGSEYTSDITNPNSKQIVSFAINYGDIYSYNYAYNIASTAVEPKAKSAGIVAMGLLNTINVVNYGNIYGSETASGIFGVMYFTKFAGEVKDAATKVNITNTINYGNVYMLTRGYNYAHGTGFLDYACITYARFKALTSVNIVTTDSTKGNNEAFTDVARNVENISVIGSVFAIANYATSANSKYINIRYLISFNTSASIVGATVSAPTGVSVDTNTLYSAHVGKNAQTGAYLNDMWINDYVQYAPLSTGSVKGNFVTNISSSGVVTVEEKSYYGIFNTAFPFSQAVLGKVALDTDTNPTDAYLTDYFQFVGFKYINPILFEKIGWQTLAYKSAADDFATNVENVIKVLEKSTASFYTSNFSTTAKKPFTWMQYSVAADMDSLISSLVAEEAYADLLTVLQYIYSNDSQSNIFITTTLREEVLNKLVENDEDLIPLLNSILTYDGGYSTVLASSIIDKEDVVKDYIDTYIGTLNETDLTSLLTAYINYLDSNNSDYFSYSTSEIKRIDLLTTLLSAVNDSTFYRELVNILDIDDNTLTATAKMFAGYQTLSDSTKLTLFTTIISYNFANSDTSRLETYINNMSSDINYYSELNKDGYQITSLTDLYSIADLNSGSTATSQTVIDERVALWNLIKKTSIFNTWFTNANFSVPNTTYFKATEYNNTYQSITEPHNDGAYRGNTSERLSYMYATDITPEVYFYGPYTGTNDTHTSTTFKFVAADGTQTINSPTVYTNTKTLNGHTNNYYSLFHSSDQSLWTSNAIMKSRGGANSTTTYAQTFAVTENTDYTTYPYPMLIYYDSNNEQLGGANAVFTLSRNYYTSGTYYYTLPQFRGFSSQQFGGKNFKDPMQNNSSFSATDWSGTLFGTNDLYMYVSSTGEKFPLSNATMGPRFTAGGNKNITLADGRRAYIYNYRCYIQDKDGAYHPVQASSSDTIEIGTVDSGGNFTAIHTLTNFDSYSREIYSFIASEVGLRMYTSTVSAQYHSTKRTGIYRRSGGWNNYFTWKQNEKVHVYTSQYIDYNYNDLKNLDGVLTEYDNSTYSDDEREIINYLFNSYFLTSGHYQLFRRLVKAALLETLGTNATNGTEYIDFFLRTNIYASQVSGFSNNVPFAYLYRQNNQTVQSYLSGLASFNNDNKKLLIYGASGNQSKYINLLKRLKQFTAIASDSDYQYYVRLLDDLYNNPAYVSNDKVLLSNYSSLSTSDLEYYLSCFNDDSDVTVNNLYDLSGKISAYTGSIAKSQATYDTTTYDYGFKFTSMTVTPASTDTRVVVLAKSTGASSTLTSGTTNVTVSTMGQYYFETNGATSITITSNSDVIVYEVYFVQDPTHNNQVTNLTGTVLDSNGAKYFTITKSEIEAQINTAINSSDYYKVTGYSVVANVSVYNTTTQVQMYFAPSKRADYGTEYAGTTFTANATTTTNYALTMQDNYYGATIFAVQYFNADQYMYSNDRYITGVEYAITYSYIGGGTVGGTSNLTSNEINVNDTSRTMPTESAVRTYVINSTSATDATLNINSVTATISISNSYGNYTLYLYNNTDGAVIANLGTVTTSGTTYNLDLTQYYGKTISVRYVYNNTYYEDSDKDFIIASYHYTVNYTLAAASNGVIYRNRLLNLDITYSDAQNKYFSYIYNNSTNAATKYNTFVKANITNFTPITTSGDVNPTNPFVNQLSDADKIEFAKVIVKNSNEGLYAVIKALCNNSSKLGNVLSIMSSAENGYTFMADTITKLNTMSLIDSKANVLKSLIASYLVADYRNIVNQNGNVYNSKYATLVSNVNTTATGSYQNNIGYINSNGTFNSSKYDKFVEYVLGQAVATTGYGIFALASSRGIQNGAFIPDNVDLTEMDVMYDTTKKISNVSYIEILTENNPSWRDNTGSSTASAYDTTDTSSVNYHVRVEMKQLVKAISNVIFELDLDCGSTSTVLYSSQNQIDYENKIITYYVSDAHINHIKNASTIKIDNLVYADTATANKAKGDNITLSKTYTYGVAVVTSETFDATKHYVKNDDTYTLASSYDANTTYYEITQIDSANAITITPEEAAYTANYSLRFIKIDNSTVTYSYYSMKYETAEGSNEFTTVQSNRNIPYYGATVTFKVQAPLPDGMDLKSFFNITGQTKNVTWEFDLNTSNNGIMNGGTAYIVVNVDISMVQGSKAFVLNLYGTSRTVNITKDPNENALITAFGYDGIDLTATMASDKTVTDSTVLFGRAFNYTDLTAPYILTSDAVIDTDKTYYTQNGTNGSFSYSKVLNPVQASLATYYEANPDFYLYAFSISSNATVKITATKEDLESGLMKYTITYVVKSESGTTQTYTHIVTENLYFDDDSVFASLYKDGEAVLESELYKTNFEFAGAEVQAQSYSSLTYDKDTTNLVAVTYNRGATPQYRIRYNISNFYGDTSHYTVVKSEDNPDTRTKPQDTYAGITISIDDTYVPGAYKYSYVYSNSGEWASEGTYVKLADDATFDSSVIYYIYDGTTGTYTVRNVTASTFARLKARLYIYQEAGDASYTRTYTFPELYIYRDFAIDALFHKLTFLDESVVLGGTASVMLPTSPIKAGTKDTDTDAVNYTDAFNTALYDDIIISPNSIEYSNEAKTVDVTDYYVVGTVSDTDLEYYAPTIKVEKHAQVFKYTTLRKLQSYGVYGDGENDKQTDKDSEILSERSNVLIYVPFTTNNGDDEVFLVLLDNNFNWLKVYPKSFDGHDNDGSKTIKTYSGNFNTADAEADPSKTTFTNDGKTYTIASYAGSTNVTSETNKNISLYMDYIGTPLEDHFWYVSYLVFSEYALYNGKTDKNNDGNDDLGAVRYYHISIVDASNTVYFDVSLYAPENIGLDEVYFTFDEKLYDSNNVYTGSVQLSCYLEKAEDDNHNPILGAANTPEAGLVLYTLKLSMAALPAGYFYFYVDLPNGYGGVCYTDRVNELDKTKAPGSSNLGSYLPHTSIIPITVGLKVIINELSGVDTSVWAVNTSDLYTRQVTYKSE